MKLNDLKPVKNSIKKRKRIGRGNSSGRGNKSGKGQDGQLSRSGYSRRPGFEGGQMPLIRRVPKRGFTNAPFKKTYQIINIEKFQDLRNKHITVDVMVKKGIIKNKNKPIKVLGRGKLEKERHVHAHKFSKSAKEKIESAGGKAIEIQNK